MNNDQPCDAVLHTEATQFLMKTIIGFYLLWGYILSRPN